MKDFEQDNVVRINQQLLKTIMYTKNSTENLLSRITFSKEILCGKPTIRGLRISVAMILELLAKEASISEILEDYPELEIADIHAALLYAYRLVANEEIVERVAS
ncbi:MAG: DUF433 domain-containing protein [Pseudanabaena sp.]